MKHSPGSNRSEQPIHYKTAVADHRRGRFVSNHDSTEFFLGK